jgi:uncharacterized protein involved in response to NO
LGITDTADAGYRLSLFMLAMLLALIGGRVIPSFTGNWLRERGEVSLPPEIDDEMGAELGALDKAALMALALLVIAEVAAPQSPATAVLAIAAGVLHFWRLARWQGFRVLAEPLLWVLHLGYGWLAAALILIGLATLGDILPQSAAYHALTTGAFGTMFLDIATRASLGHSGWAMVAGAGTTAA